MEELYAFLILVISAALICCVLSHAEKTSASAKKASTLQLQQNTKDWYWTNSIIDKADLIDEQDMEGNPRFGFRSLRNFGTDFVHDVTRPEEEFGYQDLDEDEYLTNHVYKTHPRASTPKARYAASEDNETEVRIPLDFNEETCSQFTHDEVLVNPSVKRDVGEIFVSEGRNRKSRTKRGGQDRPGFEAFSGALVDESSRGRGRPGLDIGLGVPPNGRGVPPNGRGVPVPPRCELPEHYEDPDCMAARLADTPLATSGHPDPYKLASNNRNQLAADTLSKYQTSPLEARSHHNSIASRHVQDVHNATKRLSAKSYMTPEANSSPVVVSHSVTSSARRSVQNQLHSRAPFTYQVFLTSQSLISTPITVMPYDERNRPMLLEPLVFNFQNSFITSDGVQEISFSTQRYVDIKFIELNTLLSQEGWVGKVWVRIFSEGNLISVMDYNSAVDPKFGWQRFVCTSGQAAYTREEAESNCVGGRVKRFN